MRVLYIDHPEGDFLSGAVYMGLHEILGPDNLVDWPFKKSYHGQLHTYPSVYKHGDPVGTTGPFDWMPNLPAREHSDDEVFQLVRDKRFDLVVLAAPRPYAIGALRRLISTVGRENLPPLVMMDGEDYSYIEWGLIDEFKPRVYLKRELLPEALDPGRQRIEPFPFASPIPPTDPVPKDIDIFFLCGATSGLRAEIVAALQQTYGSRFVGGSGTRMSHKEYLHAINRSRVAISVRGWGMDTLRFWEIPSFETVLVTDRLPLIRPMPFIHGETCIEFGGVQSVLDGVRCALEDEPWRQRIAKAGNAHLRQHHSARARAQQLIDHGLRG